ncbi:MAG: DNA adenine methylase [Pseudomonadota bacterium]
MSEPARPIVRYHGGKWRLAPALIDIMPSHVTYTEVFGGGASVLLRKPRSKLEVYNDLDGEMVNLFAVLRDTPEDLVEAVALTPFARTEFLDAYERVEDRVERARRTLIRSHMGRGGNGIYQKTGFRAAGHRAGSLPARLWGDMPEVISATAERMKGVVIEHRPAARVLEDHDGPETLHYIDPPYVLETRDQGRDYRHEMTDEDHVALLDQVQRLSGDVILSGYAHPLYDAALSGWRRIEKAALADGAAPRVEVVWMNFDDVLPILDGRT